MTNSASLDRHDMKSALVTGAHGFMGRHTARPLAAGCVVTGVGHGDWSHSEWRHWGLADWHNVDVNTETLVTYGGEPDAVFHCAGSGSVAFSMSHPYQDHQRTVATTLAVMEFIRVHRPLARLVFPSSAAVYGVARRPPIAIDAPIAPASPYGVHKAMAETICFSYARDFGLHVALVRLFSVYGIGLRKQLLWDACTKISHGDFSSGGTGGKTRDWIHVDDAAALMAIAASHAGPQGPVADISSARRRGWAPARVLRDEVDAYVDWYRSGAP